MIPHFVPVFYDLGIVSRDGIVKQCELLNPERIGTVFGGRHRPSRARLLVSRKRVFRPVIWRRKCRPTREASSESVVGNPRGSIMSRLHNEDRYARQGHHQHFDDMGREEAGTFSSRHDEQPRRRRSLFDGLKSLAALRLQAARGWHLRRCPRSCSQCKARTLPINQIQWPCQPTD